MILIIASELDAVAQQAAAEWPNGGAILLTPRDLCSEGWHIEVGRPQYSQIVASSGVIELKDVSGVITLLPYVPECELVSITPEDRKYVSAELTALLFYVLSTLRCPMINRPVACNLFGPDWRSQQWIEACRQVGLNAAESGLNTKFNSNPIESDASLLTLTVIGERCFGPDGDALKPKVLQLAASAGVTYLKASFIRRNGEALFHSVQLTPSLNDRDLLSLIHDYFGNA